MAIVILVTVGTINAWAAAAGAVAALAVYASADLYIAWLRRRGRA